MGNPLKTLAIIVNYRSASMALNAVRSVVDSASLGPLQVVVVDNSEQEQETQWLKIHLPEDVALVSPCRNLGFAGACNLAYHRFQSDFVLLVNPDARLLPGCLLRMQETLTTYKRAGAVTPRIFWDDAGQFLLPSSYPPLWFGLWLSDSPGQLRGLLSRGLGKLWQSHSIKVWRSTGPLAVRNLTGGLVLFKRKAIETTGYFFDSRFFLYFEDTDLFCRLMEGGYSLLVEPRAQALHHYDQCGREDLPKKREWMIRSQEIFLKKHGKRLVYRVPFRQSPGKGERSPRKERPKSLELMGPFQLDVPVHLHKGWLFEISPNPEFVPSAGQFGSGPSLDFPRSCWELLSPGRYFGRLGCDKVWGKTWTKMILNVQGTLVNGT